MIGAEKQWIGRKEKERNAFLARKWCPITFERTKERMVGSEQRKVNKRPFRLGDQLHRVCIIHGELGQAAESSTSSSPWSLNQTNRKKRKETEGGHEQERENVYLHQQSWLSLRELLFRIVAASFGVIWKINRQTVELLVKSHKYKARCFLAKGTRKRERFSIVIFIHFPWKIYFRGTYYSPIQSIVYYLIYLLHSFEYFIIFFQCSRKISIQLNVWFTE